MNAICKQFGMDPVEPPEVKAADSVLLVTEQRDLLLNSIPDFNVKPLIGIIYPVTSRQAELLFLRRFKELTTGQQQQDPGLGWFPGRTDRT
jgi:hypothetical protein